jgi:hypothetical protein
MSTVTETSNKRVGSLFPAHNLSPHDSDSTSDTLSEIERFINASQAPRPSTSGVSSIPDEGQSNNLTSSSPTEAPYLALFQQVLQQQNAAQISVTTSGKAASLATGQTGVHGEAGMKAKSTLGSITNPSGGAIQGVVGPQDHGMSRQQGTQSASIQQAWNMGGNRFAGEVTPTSWSANPMWAQIQQLLQMQTQQQASEASSLPYSPVIQAMMSLIVQGAQNQNAQQALLASLIAAVQRQQQIQQQQPTTLEGLLASMTGNTSASVIQPSDSTTMQPPLPVTGTVASIPQAFQPAGVNPLHFMMNAQNVIGAVPPVIPLAQPGYSATATASTAPSQLRNANTVSTSTSSADESGGPPNKRYKRTYNHESFPAKLHRLLAETEAENKDDIISFNAEGTRRLKNRCVPLLHTKIDSTFFVLFSR